MKKKIERLAKGIFEYSKPEIIVSDDILRIELNSDEVYKGTFNISNSFGTCISGIVYSGDLFLTIEKPNFSDVFNVVPFSFVCPDTDDSEFECEINIVSDAGEKCIPFVAIINDRKTDTSLGNVDTYFKFQSLANVSWCEALRVFYDKAFYDSVIRRDFNLKKHYDVLRNSCDKNLALREFILLSGKITDKPFTVDTSEICMPGKKGTYLCQAVVKKADWTYLKISVKTDCDAAELSDDVIDNDFSEDGTRALKIIFKFPENIYKTQKYTLFLKSERHALEVPITVKGEQSNDNYRALKNDLKRDAVNLYLSYLKYRVAGDAEELVKESLGQISEIKGKFSELNKIKKTMGKSEEKTHPGDGNYKSDSVYPNDCVYPDADESEKRLETYEKYVLGLKENKYNETEFVSGTIRTFLQVTFMPGLDTKNYYSEILYKIKEGKRSPLLFTEASLILEDHPEFLTAADIKESGILFYILRNGLYTDEITAKACEEIKRARNLDFSPILLKEVYDLKHDPEILFILCEKLITNKKTGKVWYPYFERAVKEDPENTEACEYFVREFSEYDGVKADPNVIRTVLMSTRDEELKSRIYYYIIKNKESNAALFNAYRDKIKDFAYRMIKTGKIDLNLRTICNEFLNEIPLDECMIATVPELMLTYRVSTAKDDFKEVVVTDPYVTETKTYKLNAGYADVLLFTEESEVWFKDEEGNLFYDYDKPERYLNSLNILFECYEKGSADPYLLLNIWEQNKKYHCKPEIYSDIQKKIADLDIVTDAVKNECNFALVNYYYDNYSAEGLDDYILKTDCSYLSKNEREKFIEIIAARRMFGRVFDFIKKYGYACVSAKTLSKLSEYEIENAGEDAKREDIVNICYESYKRGNRDALTVDFLAKNYYGTCCEMADIRKTAHELGLFTEIIEENLLAQVMFTESYIESAVEIFSDFYKKTENRLVVRAFLSYTSYNFFVNDEEQTDEFFDILKNDPSTVNSEICTLALLKYLSHQKKLDSETAKACENILRNFVREKKIFAFFKNFEGKINVPYAIRNKFFAEYKTDPEKHVYIYYSLNGFGVAKKEEMTSSGFGFFTKPFILFDGDVLQYYITEINNGREEITESRSVEFKADFKNKKELTKYDEINNILIAISDGNAEMALDGIKRYTETDFVINHDFYGI